MLTLISTEVRIEDREFIFLAISLPLSRRKPREKDFETGFQTSLFMKHRRLLPLKVVEQATIPPLV